MAMAQGVVRGPTDLAAHAETLSPAQLRALKFGADPQTREIGYPKKTVFRTGLHQIDDELLEQVLLGWQSQVLGPWQDQIVIVDGKKVRHAGVEIVNAADSQGRFLGSTVTARKSNEIPAFQSRFKSAHGGRERLHALIHAKLPSVLDLGNRKDASYQAPAKLLASSFE